MKSKSSDKDLTGENISVPRKDKKNHYPLNTPKKIPKFLKEILGNIKIKGETSSTRLIVAELAGMDAIDSNSALLELQRTHGNQYVQKVAGIQSKLKISEHEDIYEHEADRVAEQVMQMPEPGIQRKCPGDKNCLLEDDQKKKNRLVQLKVDGSGAGRVSTPDNLMSNLGHGHQLDSHIRSFMEPRFGYDFSDVMVHTDSNASKSAHKMNASAYTFGNDVVFGKGQYTPGTKIGRQLIAHELTHVIQQGSGTLRDWSSHIARKPAANSPIKADMEAKKKEKIYPPIYWSIDRENNRVLAIPKPGTDINEVAKFLYDDINSVSELVSVNKISATAPLLPGTPLKLTGKKLSEAAFNHLNTSTKIPLEVKDPEAFLAKKKNLDEQLEKDFIFIVSKLNEAHYSDSDEVEVITILRKWADEKFTTNPKFYPKGGEYLDKIFLKLSQKTKDVGVLTTQRTNYYSLIFNHFDRVAEVRLIRDMYSKNFKGEGGLKELSFGSFFWEQVKEGKVRDQIFAYFKGLGKGIWSGAKGTVMMAYTLVTDPKKFLTDLKNLPGALRTMWEKKGELWNKFANASSEKQAEMIGEVFGEIEFMIASAAVGGAAAKGVEKLAQVPGKVGKIAKVAQIASKLPQKAFGAVAKGVKTVVVLGVKGAAKGAKFAARGIYKIGKTVFRGTWSVVEKTVEKITKRVYYFFDDLTETLREIPAKFAKECIECRSPCKLTAKATEVAEKTIHISEESINDILAKFPNLTIKPNIRKRVERILKTSNINKNLLQGIMEATKANNEGAARILRYIERLSKNPIPNMEIVLKDLALGGNKFKGAEWVLRYIDRKRLWSKIDKFEKTFKVGKKGKRVYDVIIEGKRYEFKSWWKFKPDTFIKQITKDIRKGTHLETIKKLKWIFEKRGFLKKRKEIIQHMIDALDNADIERSIKEKIKNSLKSIVEASKLARR
jgi:hypothetical protein